MKKATILMALVLLLSVCGVGVLAADVFEERDQVVLTEKVDPAVMGGVLLEMNGQRYDNTIRHRLSAIRQVMTGEA